LCIIFFDFISSCLILFFPDLRRLQVGQKKSCDGSFASFASLVFLAAASRKNGRIGKSAEIWSRVICCVLKIKIDQYHTKYNIGQF